MTDHGGAASPRTEAGKRFHANEHGAVCSFAASGSCALVNDGPWGKAWLSQIEAEAAQEAPAPEGLAAAYRERAMVVASLFRVGGYHPVVVPAPDAEGWWIVYAETPEGQVSWHIVDADLPIFEGTGWTALGTYEWDGHTTDEKYARLARLRAEARPPEGLDADRLARASALYWGADEPDRPLPQNEEWAEGVAAIYSRLSAGAYHTEAFGPSPDTRHLGDRAEARPPEGLDPDALRKAIVLHDHRGNGGLAIRADHLSFHFTSECAALIAAEYARLSAGGATKP